jgi:DNA-binding transcriptional LysR family regulator
MQLGSIEAIKRMVRAGLGYSIVHAWRWRIMTIGRGYAFNR